MRASSSLRGAGSTLLLDSAFAPGGGKKQPASSDEFRKATGCFSACTRSPRCTTSSSSSLRSLSTCAPESPNSTSVDASCKSSWASASDSDEDELSEMTTRFWWDASQASPVEVPFGSSEILVCTSPHSMASGLLADPYRDDGLGGVCYDGDDACDDEVGGSAETCSLGIEDAEAAAAPSPREERSPAVAAVWAAVRTEADQVTSSRAAIANAPGLGAPLQADLLAFLSAF
eukprot:TRINITY_DN20308_c0_g1_i1.p2 TRINITY_DN20308_c0_g1~~TRINITY_DN20308_c0_g1_i1.p2  ORF type:complete len:231 (-),score=46.71 TRINITY_DN20308_c0_g1_i1:291-983(-)